MKKANIILSAIGLLSVIGGALAFKAQHRFSGTLFCYTTVGTGTAANKTYRAILSTKYAVPEVGGTTLFCTVPGPNTSYNAIKVAASL